MGPRLARMPAAGDGGRCLKDPVLVPYLEFKLIKALSGVQANQSRIWHESWGPTSKALQLIPLGWGGGSGPSWVGP